MKNTRIIVASILLGMTVSAALIAGSWWTAVLACAAWWCAFGGGLKSRPRGVTIHTVTASDPEKVLAELKRRRDSRWPATWPNPSPAGTSPITRSTPTHGDQ